MAIRNFASVSGSIKECEAIPQDKEALRQILRGRLKDIFPSLNLIAHDYRVGAADFNTLAYDSHREKFVIVEYMRSENGLASRVIEYDDELKKREHQNTALKLYANKFDKNKAPTQWPGAYVIAISDHFSDRDKELAPRRKFNLPTELHTVTIYRTCMMKIESIDNVHDEKTNTILPKPATKPARRGRPAKGTIRYVLSKCNKTLRDLGLALNDELTRMQLTRNIPSSNQYATFALDSRRVCAIRVLKNKIRLIYSTTKNTRIKESDFVYSTNDWLGRYASDITSRADINKAVQIVKNICNNEKMSESPKVSKADGFQMRDAARSGATSTQSRKSKTKESNQKPATSSAEFEFSINGQKFRENSAIGAVKKIVEHLASNDDQFLKRIEGMKHGKTRKYITRDKNMLYPGRPDLSHYSFKIPPAPGWYLGTNYSVSSLKKIAALVKEAADPKIRDTMTGSIFELYTPKHTASSPKDTKLVTDDDDEIPVQAHLQPSDRHELSLRSRIVSAKQTGDEIAQIPYSEDVKNEFKSSFVHDYKAADFVSKGDHNAAVKIQERIRKNNFGFGLEWDVAKAIAGFSNSYLEEGRIWVGVKDNKDGPSTILGLEHDFQKANAKDWQDDFRNWINSLIGNCIRDYSGFHNFDLFFPRVSDKRICLIVVKKSSKAMMLVEKQNPDNTIFYLRNKIAPRTDRLRGVAFFTYMNERFPNQPF